MPPMPSSPTTPPHSVLSQSSTMHFGAGRRLAQRRCRRRSLPEDVPEVAGVRLLVDHGLDDVVAPLDPVSALPGVEVGPAHRRGRRAQRRTPRQAAACSRASRRPTIGVDEVDARPDAGTAASRRRHAEVGRRRDRGDRCRRVPRAASTTSAKASRRRRRARSTVREEVLEPPQDDEGVDRAESALRVEARPGGSGCSRRTRSPGPDPASSSAAPRNGSSGSAVKLAATPIREVVRLRAPVARWASHRRCASSATRC